MAWAKSHFDVQPPHMKLEAVERNAKETKKEADDIQLAIRPHEALTPSSSVVAERSELRKKSLRPLGRASNGAASSSGDKRQRKERQRLELRRDAVWTCTRCGWSCASLPLNAATGKPNYMWLFAHLSGQQQSQQQATASASSMPPLCSAGRLTYLKQQEAKGSGSAASPSLLAPLPSDGSRHSPPLPATVTAEQLIQFLSFPSSVTAAATSTGALHRDATPILFLLHNPKTPRNIGSLLRAIHCCGYASQSMVLFTGSRLLHALRQDPHLGTDTQQARKEIPLLHLKEVSLLWQCLAEKAKEAASQPPTSSKSYGHHVTALELIEGATPLPLYSHPYLPAGRGELRGDHSESLPLAYPNGGGVLVYVAGAEDGSVPLDYLSHCTDAVYIPTLGSLNLSVSLTVLLYDRVRALWSCQANGLSNSLHEAMEGDTQQQDCREDVVMRSRNRNNRLAWQAVHSAPGNAASEGEEGPSSSS